MEKIIPPSFLEALDYRSKHDCYIVAGGSDIMLQKRNTAGELPKFDKDVLFISNLDELHKEYITNNELHIGATMTLEEILRHKDTPNILKECLKELASVNIRHFATLPGNIANASPAGDTIVVDILLDARVKLTSIHESREILVDEFVKGIRKIDLAKDEIIEEVIFPLDKNLVSKWYKVGSRKAESISKLSFASAYKIEDGIIKDFRVVFGSVFIKAIRSKEIEKKIIGLSLDELKSRIDEFVDAYDEVISPIDDQRSTASYRRTVSQNCIREFLTELVKGGN